MKKLVLSVLLSFAFISCLSASTHKIKAGDTLWDIAGKNYGDPTLYTVLVEVNGITNPNSIPIGTVINIPSKSEIQKIANETDPQKRSELINQANGGQSSGSDDNKNNGKSGSSVNLKNTPVDSSFDYITSDELDLSKVQKTEETPLSSNSENRSIDRILSN